jgi:deoxyribodipyrimidine photolyase
MLSHILDFNLGSAEKFDSNCEYIKQWVPELRNMNLRIFIIGLEFI